MRPGFFLKEAFRSIRRNAVPTLAAAMTVLITTLVLGVFIPFVQSASGKAEEIQNRIELEILVKDKTTKEQVKVLGDQLRDIDHVRSVDFFNKEQNFKRSPLYKGSRKLFKKSPVNASFVLKLEDPEYTDSVIEALEPKDGAKPLSPHIEKVLDREEDRQQIVSATDTIKLLLGGLALLLVISSLLLVSNTIRLSVFARRREVEVMRLVGGTSWFIRWPFIFEGLIVGALGGIGAVALLWVFKLAVVDPLSKSFKFLSSPEALSFSLLALLLLASAMVVSAAGCGLTLRRFLRI